MKLTDRLLRVLLLLCLAVSCEKEPAEKQETVNEDVTIFGEVTSDGKGINGVVISDGIEVTLTDKDGRYALKSDKSQGSVFMSVPSGYEPLSDGVLPKFFARLTRRPDELERVDFKLVPADQSSYRMLAFGDMHLAGRSFCSDISQFREFASEVNELVASSDVPVYALTLGDMTWDLFWESNNYGLEEYRREIQRDFSGFQIYHSMGNHDNDPSFVGDAAAESTYEQMLCPNHYSFNVGGEHYIVLDDVQYNNTSQGQRSFLPQISKEQLAWLKKDLEHVDRSTPVLVAMHVPLYRNDASGYIYNFSEVIRCFSGFDYVQFLTGHTHVVYNVDMLSRSIHIFENNSGAVCGAWWMTDTACKAGMNLCSDGAPGGYRVLDVDGTGISWRYKGTGCADDFQFRTYDRNQICMDVDGWVPHATDDDKATFTHSVGSYGQKSTANQVLINVWDYDPSWKISVSENGRQLDVRQLKNVKDPLYLAAYEAYEYEHGYSVSYPCGTTDHIFSVTASSPTSTLEIKVTDRFGRVYTQKMTRPQAFYEPR